jgi:glutathione S-transferase
VLRVHRVPFSTNVERVAIAAAHKGVAVEWVDHDPADRSAIVALSGQALVPVLELPGGGVLCDSPAILRRLEADHPDPPLWPADPGAVARVDVFVEWFNEVWKGPPNALAADPSALDAPAWAARLRSWTATFDALLRDTGWLAGPALTAADVVAYPFLRYGIAPPDPADTDPFHAVLRTWCAPAPEHAATRDWLARMAALPQA